MLSGMISSAALKAARLSADSDDIVIGDSDTAFHADADDNIAIGIDALDATSGAAINNIAIGTNANSGVTTGDDNIAIGKDSAKALTTGLKNIAIGTDTLETADGAEADNLAIGYNALNDMNHDSATRNIAIGNLAGQDMGAHANTDNILIGYQAGGGTWANAATQNVAVGNYALDGALNDAYNNSAIGYSALGQLTTGDNNMAFGKNAGQALTTGSNNTFIGYEANADAAADNGHLRLGYYGAVKYITNHILCDAADSGDNSIVVEVCKIPALSIIKSISASVHTLANISTYALNLQLSTETGTAADGALVNASTTITVPELLGAGAANTYQRNSGVAMAGTAADIVAGSGGTAKYTYYNQPTTTIVGTSDTYLYVCNAGTGNGTTTASTKAKLEIIVEYIGLD